MSTKQRSKLLKPVIKELVESIPALRSHKDPHTVAAQVLHAALGSISPERASKFDLPINANYRPYDWRYEYNFVAASERIHRMLGLPQSDCDVAAQQTVDVLTKCQIGINLVRLMFDHRYDLTCDEHFKHLQKALKVTPDGGFLRPPTTATMAIANGELSKPDTSWKARFDLLGDYPWSRIKGGLLEIVTKQQCYLWSFPPAQLKATVGASMDSYDGQGGYDPKSASLGMGFAIIAEPWQRKDHITGKMHDQYSVYTPFWSYSERFAAHRGDGNGWRLGNIFHESIYEGRPSDPKLKWHLHGGLTSLPLLKACPTCRTFYVPQHNARPPGMPSACGYSIALQSEA